MGDHERSENKIIKRSKKKASEAIGWVKYQYQKSLLSCMTFAVNETVTMLGVKIPTQTKKNSKEMYEEYAGLGVFCLTDQEILVDCTTKPCVQYNTFLDVYFPQPITIDKNKGYLIRVSYLNPGHYPIAVTGDNVEKHIGNITVRMQIGRLNTEPGIVRGLIFQK